MMNSKLTQGCKQILILCPIGIVLLVVVQLVLLNQFNSRVYRNVNGDVNQATYYTLDARKDSTSTWLKRDFSWKGKKVDLTGQTIDGVLENNCGDTITDWSVKINITKDCFINNAWCGRTEIHQADKKGEDHVQTLDLRNYKLKDITLTHMYDGDLLIPLKKGDYVIYYPSVKDSEVPVQKFSGLTMGVIFYYFDSTDFMKYELNYRYHRNFTYGAIYQCILGLILFWIMGGVFYLGSLQIYKDAQKQMELKKSGLSCMSDIYQAIYILDLNKDEIVSVTAEGGEEKEERSHAGAAQKFVKKIVEDAADAYRQMAADFCDISTLPDRLSEKDIITFEYISRRTGWNRLRFFVMDRIEGRPVDKVLCTILNIDAEKQEMDEIEKRILAAESGTREKGLFLDSVSAELLLPANRIMELNDRILADAGQEDVKEAADGIRYSGTVLISSITDLLDYARMETEGLTVKHEAFSLTKLIRDVKDYATMLVDGESVEFKTDISKTLPQTVTGDEEYLRKILCNMVYSASAHTASGSIIFSVFGRKLPDREDRAHLVFSMRDTGDGAVDEEHRLVGLRLAEGILGRIGSSLQVVNTPEDGTEVFFELETEV